VDEFIATPDEIDHMAALVEKDEKLTYGEKQICTLLLLVLTGQGYTHDSLRDKLAILEDNTRG